MSEKQVKICLNRQILRKEEETFRRLVKTIDVEHRKRILSNFYKNFLCNKVKKKDTTFHGVIPDAKYDFTSMTHHDDPLLLGLAPNDVNRIPNTSQTPFV